MVYPCICTTKRTPLEEKGDLDLPESDIKLLKSKSSGLKLVPVNLYFLDLAKLSIFAVWT